MEEYKKMWKNYAVFNGRSTRRDFWMAILVNCFVAFALGFVAAFIKAPWLSGIYALALIIPSLAMQIRRLHDTNKSGWCLLLSLIPAVGGLIVLFFLCQPSVDEGNNFGDIV